jgi:hypothetical protein
LIERGGWVSVGALLEVAVVRKFYGLNGMLFKGMAIMYDYF